ncbi:chloramphenicol acetyltransferase [Chitiniphilus purpureus]|uniref:Chloramphenicol acetyltransferase n=1 Tax=Chitiniphilus purpureus TaxID=2981137 RepID=A0ABY6DPR7_9NEIS|nr:chloramphenicol acetyltransferase [Chitiniphilus sp. CD1]UXY16354.1 chloramphenicol acetyltransferase [Chitiniphilus sp. CD1]
MPIPAPLFTPIDLARWPRREIFERFNDSRRCNFDMATHVDVTPLLHACHTRGFRFFPAIAAAICQVINTHQEYRSELDDAGTPGYWNVLHPMYTVFNPDNETFTHVLTEYGGDVADFCSRLQADIAQYRGCTDLYPQQPLPRNLFAITTVPWVSFISISYHLYDDGRYMIPFVTLGKYFAQGEQTLLPVNVRFHHAVCDGYHAGRFFNALQEAVARMAAWVAAQPMRH